MSKKENKKSGILLKEGYSYGQLRTTFNNLKKKNDWFGSKWNDEQRKDIYYLFGPPPYDFLEKGDIPKKFLGNNVLNVSKVKAIAPAYNKLKRREFVSPEGALFFQSRDIQENKRQGVEIEMRQSELEEGVVYGDQLFWVKIPISKRRRLDSSVDLEVPREHVGKSIELLHVGKRLVCIGTLERTFQPKSKGKRKRKAVGTALIKEFTVSHKASEEEYDQYIANLEG